MKILHNSYIEVHFELGNSEGNMFEKDTFFEEYPIEEIFDKSGLKWENLAEIYNDYNENYFEDYQKTARDLITYLEESAPQEVRAIYGRAKNSQHLIEKIIRKVGSENSEKYRLITKDNYRTKITDLIGIRILVLAKEEWDIIDKHLHDKFQEFREPPVAYVCYGDREIFDISRIQIDYTNKGYRSQHYIVDYAGCICEIQVRTLAEEVYGEYDHRVRYPYQVDNKFLHRYSKIISKSTSELDDLISTCISLDGNILNTLDAAFENDSYIEWTKNMIDGNNNNSLQNEKYIDYNGKTAKEIIVDKLLKREE